ncbi:25S rRNA uridine-N3-methyltransferase [Hondaea fermentalgiana]|uniref:25S rRNA uridine-N3-methyltransferase n=1 Tax=Hondaea fermentalgiana TaxID=2315210 RepID=A0A2R5GYP5_9STRA|nr:25S rRNA uridine-N3-methyltransferase [Hondaea fermentalgiana]|eukprot:GBG33114.1 25S rRNA uridine-N3-methyltransferase [Hondaea fermentalgiana]
MARKGKARGVAALEKKRSKEQLATAARLAAAKGGFFAKAQLVAREARRAQGPERADQPGAAGPGDAQGAGKVPKKKRKLHVKSKLGSSAPSSMASSRRSGGGGSGGGGGAGLVVAGATVLDVVATSGGSVAGINPKAAGPYRSQDRILLVGEGNFSFAAGLSTIIGGSRLVASSLDTRQEVMEKYGMEAIGSLQALRLARGKAHHGIDATKAEDLRSCLGQVAAFDTIGFNFPHLGGATAEAVDANRAMLRGFFAACKQVLATKSSDPKSRPGRVAVTLRSTSFYESWGLENLAREEGFRLLETFPFEKEHYPGYQEARTNPAARASPGTEAATTRVFVTKK